MVHLRKIIKEQEQVLFNVMQKYLYEMSQYYDKSMDEQGNYPYKYLPCYFTEEDRQAYFIYEDTLLIGFVLVNKHSFTKEEIDCCIAEFCIFPTFRKKGYGLDAVEAIRTLHPGSLQLKYSKANTLGMAFWKKVCKKYQGIEIVSDDEIIVTIHS